MQGAEKQDELLFDLPITTLELPPGIFRFLATHRQELFPDSAFSDLFPSRRGRPSLPASSIICALILQNLHGLSDSETAEACTWDQRYKQACGFGTHFTGFDPTTLVYWRKRIAESKNPNRIFELINTVVTESGVIKGKNTRLYDSTVVHDAVAQQDTYTMIASQIRKIRSLSESLLNLVEQTCTNYPALHPGGYASTSKAPIDWSCQDQRDALITALVNDANLLIEATTAARVEGVVGPEVDDAVGLLALVAGQDVEPADEDDQQGCLGKWRIRRGVAKDRVISTVDPETRCVHKTRSAKAQGFKGHAAVEPETGIITDAKLTKGSGQGSSDSSVGVEFLQADNDVAQVAGDAAYASGAFLDACDGKGVMPIVRPTPLKNNQVAGGFVSTDFRVDYQAHTMHCPGGVCRAIPDNGVVSFGAACAQCPLRAQCTTSLSGRYVTVGAFDRVLRRQREFADSQWFQARYQVSRPGVERTMADMTRKGRRMRFVGVVKNDWWWKVRAAAVNIRQLASLGVGRRDGSWAVAA